MILLVGVSTGLVVLLLMMFARSAVAAVAQGGALGCAVATSQNQNKKQTTDEVKRLSGGRKLQVEVAGKTGISDFGQEIIIPFSTDKFNGRRN